MERVVDLLHWLLKRDDCYQSHLISSHRDCNPMHMLFCHSRLKCDMCVMCVPIRNADGCHSIHSKLIEILQPDTQLTWLSNTSIRSLAFGWFQYLLLIYCGSTQCVLVPALCKFSLSTHTFYHSFVHGWHGMMVCLLLWFSQCHFVVQMLLVAKLEIRKFWLEKTCTFSAFAKRKKNRILKLKTSTCSTRSCMFVCSFTVLIESIYINWPMLRVRATKTLNTQAKVSGLPGVYLHDVPFQEFIMMRLCSTKCLNAREYAFLTSHLY